MPFTATEFLDVFAAYNDALAAIDTAAPALRDPLRQRLKSGQ